jgi:hypothetical protein
MTRMSKGYRFNQRFASARALSASRRSPESLALNILVNRHRRQTVREHAVESADGQQSYGRWPPGETALTGQGTVSVTLPLFYGVPPWILRLTPAFDFLGASAGRVSQLIEAPYYTADRWHTRSLSVRRCRLLGTMFQEEHLRAGSGRT